MNASLYEIAQVVQGVVIGDETLRVSSLSPIDNILANSLVFAEGDENIKQAEASEATAILVNQQTRAIKKPVIQVSNPLKAFIALLNHFYPPLRPNTGLHPTAVIADDVHLGQHVSIGPYVVIEAGSRIGDNCVIKAHVSIGRDVEIGCDAIIHPHVTIYDGCQIGHRVYIHASSVIGADGFGYTPDEGRHLKVPHIGNVVIGDDVEIGANTVIDRATMGSTIVGQGTKIDNLVQVAHSVKLGQHNVLCAFTGIAGSTTTGNHVVFAANVGVSDHVRIDDEVILGARTGVPPKKHLKKGNVYLGNPARPKQKAIEQELAANRIPFIRKQLKSLSERVERLASLINKQDPS